MISTGHAKCARGAALTHNIRSAPTNRCVVVRRRLPVVAVTDITSEAQFEQEVLKVGNAAGVT